jgi:[ribosomal protein S18]-alanine N-acetyltransferase
VGLRVPEHLGFLTRGMLEADLEQVLEIERSSFGIPWTPRMFLSEMRHELSWTRVLVDPVGAVGGYLVARFHGELWHIMDIAVRADLRTRGLAAALLDEFLEATAQSGAEYTLEVRPSNDQALALYRSRGFEEVGRRPGYYHDNREDALIMVRQPGPGPQRDPSKSEPGDRAARPANGNGRPADRQARLGSSVAQPPDRREHRP